MSISQLDHNEITCFHFVGVKSLWSILMYEIADTAIISQKGPVYSSGLSDKGEQFLPSRRQKLKDMNSKTRCNLLLDKGLFRELCVVGKKLHVETGKVGKIFREKRMVYQGIQNLSPSQHTILSKVPKFLCREMIASLLLPSRKALPALCTPDRLWFQRQRPCRLSYYLSGTRDRAYGSQVLPSFAMSEWIELRVVQTQGQNTWIMIQGELSKMTGNLS